MEGVYLWDGAVIGNSCTITESIIANNATIKEHTTIEKGCLISLHVTVGPDDNIPRYSRLSLLPQPQSNVFGESSDEEDDGEGTFIILIICFMSGHLFISSFSRPKGIEW